MRVVLISRVKMTLHYSKDIVNTIDYKTTTI